MRQIDVLLLINKCDNKLDAECGSTDTFYTMYRQPLLAELPKSISQAKLKEETALLTKTQTSFYLRLKLMRK